MTLLDDRGDVLASAHAMAKKSGAIVEALDPGDHVSRTIRLAPPGRAVALSILSAGTSKGTNLNLSWGAGARS